MRVVYEYQRVTEFGESIQLLYFDFGGGYMLYILPKPAKYVLKMVNFPV